MLDDGYGSILLRAVVGEILVSIVLVLVGGRVFAIQSTVSAREGDSPSMGSTTYHTGTQAIMDLLPYIIWVHQVSSGRVQGSGDDVHQPPDPFHAPPCKGHISSYGER